MPDMEDALPKESPDMRTKCLLAARKWLEEHSGVRRKLVPTGTKVGGQATWHRGALAYSYAAAVLNVEEIFSDFCACRCCLSIRKHIDAKR